MNEEDEAFNEIEQEPVPPPWWPAVENILNEYGLHAIDFVADFKNAMAQRKPLTDQTIELKAANLENATSDVKWGFEQGAKWARENT